MQNATDSTPERVPSQGKESYEVIGGVFIHGFMYAEGLLGPPSPRYRARVQADSSGFTLPSYFDIRTRETILDDPRLDPIPEEWEQLPENIGRSDDICKV
jgi:hypothetical protein